LTVWASRNLPVLQVWSEGEGMAKMSVSRPCCLARLKLGKGEGVAKMLVSRPCCLARLALGKGVGVGVGVETTDRATGVVWG
jgi:hypothetical protein